MTGGQITLLGCRDVRMPVTQGKVAKIASRFGKVSCLVCFAIFGRFLGFGGKRFSRENVPEMTELEGFS